MEIGSILELDIKRLFEPTQDKQIKFPFMEKDEWYLDFFNTGRSATESLLRHFTDKTIYMPSFMCSVVIDAVKRAGCQLKYYPINERLEADVDYLAKLDMKNAVLYVAQYFGKPLDKKFMKLINQARQDGAVILEDITMSLMSQKSSTFAFGDFVMGSIRKWEPIPDGAFIAAKKPLPLMPKQDAAYDYTLYYFAAQVMKHEYVRCPQSFNKQRFLDFSALGIESLFSDYTVRKMSDIAKRILLTRSTPPPGGRLSNWKQLYGILAKLPEIILPVEYSEGMLSFGMFILTENRDGLLNHLIDNDVYCNVNWRPNEATEQFPGSSYLSKHCITIPCDDRYGNEEMVYIGEVVRSFFERNTQ